MTKPPPIATAIKMPPRGPAGFPQLVLLMGIVLAGLVGVMVWLKFHIAELRKESGPFLERPEKFVRDIDKSEDAHAVAMASLQDTFLKGLLGRDWELAEKGLTEKFEARFPRAQDGDPVPDGLVNLRKYDPKKLPKLDREGFLDALRANVTNWSAVQRAHWRTSTFLLDADGKGAYVEAQFQLAGFLASGGRAELSGEIRAQLVSADGKAWRIRQFGLYDGWRAEAMFDPFWDITEASRLQFDETPAAEWTWEKYIGLNNGTGRSGGLTVADFNHDGFPDVLAWQPGRPARTFLNDGHGEFSKGNSPVGSPDGSGWGGLFIDLDGDGVEEFVGSNVVSGPAGEHFGELYRRKGDDWELVPGALRISVPDGDTMPRVHVITPLDADKDGRLDLFVCVYADTYRSMHPWKLIVTESDAPQTFLFMNQGALKFTEESGPRLLHGKAYTRVARAFDFDFDGDTDIFAGNELAPNDLWLNDGKGQFKRAKDHEFVSGLRVTSGASIADWDNSGRWSMVTSGLHSHAANRIVPLLKDLTDPSIKAVSDMAGGNQFFENNQEAHAWPDFGSTRGVNAAGWAFGCVFWDPDNDGDRDLFVANGYFTDTAGPEADFDSLFWRETAGDVAAREKKVLRKDAPPEAQAKFAGSWSGHQRDAAFHNVDGPAPRFYDLAYLFGLDFEDDGRSVCPVDIDGDGDQDLVLLSRSGLRLIENRTPLRHFARVKLTATTGPACALGAIVRVTAGGVTQQDFVRIQDGYRTQVPLDLHFGLGENLKIDRLFIQWPSGTTTDLLDVPVDRLLEVTEGTKEARASELPRWTRK